MKTIFTLLFCSFTFLSVSQKLDHGYIVTAQKDTLKGKLYITINNSIKFNNNGSKVKYKKLNLLDYGAIKEGKMLSYYSKTAFPHITKKGLIVLNSGMSIPAYIYKQSARKLNFYNPDKDKAKVKIEDVDSYQIFTEDGDINYYKRLAVPRTYKALVGVKNKKDQKQDLFFGKQLALGAINLYATYSSTSSFSGSLHSAPVMSNEFTSVYLLEKGEEVEIIPKTKLNINSNDLLKAMLKDDPDLAKKIGKKGYKIKNIKKIIDEYNQYNKEG